MGGQGSFCISLITSSTELWSFYGKCYGLSLLLCNEFGREAFIQVSLELRGVLYTMGLGCAGALMIFGLSKEAAIKEKKYLLHSLFENH